MGIVARDNWGEAVNLYISLLQLVVPRIPKIHSKMLQNAIETWIKVSKPDHPKSSLLSNNVM